MTILRSDNLAAFRSHSYKLQTRLTDFLVFGLKSWKIDLFSSENACCLQCMRSTFVNFIHIFSFYCLELIVRCCGFLWLPLNVVNTRALKGTWSIGKYVRAQVFPSVGLILFCNNLSSDDYCCSKTFYFLSSMLFCLLNCSENF